jgi:hypothetical protein
LQLEQEQSLIMSIVLVAMVSSLFLEHPLLTNGDADVLPALQPQAQ